MRNLKKLLAVVVAICVLATFTVPAFAADAAAPAVKTDASICTDLGVIKGSGTGVTAEYLATQPDRLQGAIMFLRLKGLEDTAKAFIGTDNFADVAGLSDTNTAILAYLKANPDLGFGGVGENKFSPLTKMSAKEYYKVMLVALGYTYEKDFLWSNVFSFAASKGLTGLIDNESFTVADLCKGTVEALKATVKGGTDTLIASLVAGGSISATVATASGLYNPVAKALEVVSATTDNLKTAKIVFNKELDSATVKAANFYNSDVTADPKLLDDKKTVIVVFNTKKEMSKTADIVIENVKATDATKIAKVTKTITFVDTTIPVISGAVAKNAKTLIITASEPIADVQLDYVKSFGDIKIDGTAVLATPAFDYAKNTITLKLASVMAKGTHKLDIAKLADFAGYVAVATSYNIDVAEDTTAPVLTGAKINSTTEMELTFSEDIDTNGTFTVNGTDATFKSKSATDASKITITLGKALDIGATVEVKIGYKGQKDVIGNEVKDTAYFITKFNDDTAKPTVAVTIESGNKIVLTFSKAMAKVGTLKLYNTSDSKQIGTSIDLSNSSKATWESDNTVCKISAATAALDDTNTKEIKLNLTSMKDATIRANELGETNLTANALDTKKPTVSPSFTVKAGTSSDKSDDTITFYFSEAMDADTAKNLSNYVISTPGAILTSAQALSLYSDASFKEMASDGKNVVLKVKGISGATLEGFTVYALKDVAGNMLKQGPVTKALTDGANINQATSKATGESTIELYLDQDIGTFAPNAVVIREAATENATVSAVVIKTAIDSTNAKKVTLTLDRSLGTTTAKAYLSQLDKALIKDVYGTESATFAAFKLNDAIKPTVTFTATSAGILIEFSEVVSTTGSTLLSEMTLTKDGTDKLSTAVITEVTAGKVFKVGGLDVNTEYKISLYPRLTVDLAGTPNPFVPTEVKAVTTKE